MFTVSVISLFTALLQEQTLLGMINITQLLGSKDENSNRYVYVTAMLNLAFFDE